jgi:hypothetical protein
MFAAYEHIVDILVRVLGLPESKADLFPAHKALLTWMTDSIASRARETEAARLDWSIEADANRRGGMRPWHGRGLSFVYGAELLCMVIPFDRSTSGR